MQKHFGWCHWKLWVTILDECKYLVRVLNKSDCDWMELYQNISNESKFWEYFVNILESDVIDTHIYGQFFWVILHTVVCYVSDTWVITTPKMPVFEVVCFCVGWR